jgi:hypothetical protein
LVKKKTGRFGKKWGHFWLKKTQGRFGKKSDEGFLMTRMPMYFIVTVYKILLCLEVFLL